MPKRKVPQFPCIVCTAEVTDDCNAVQCDQCLKWQHLDCCNNISRELYDSAAASDAEFPWVCEGCSVPVATPSRPVRQAKQKHKFIKYHSVVSTLPLPQQPPTPAQPVPQPVQQVTPVDSPPHFSPDRPPVVPHRPPSGPRRCQGQRPARRRLMLPARARARHFQRRRQNHLARPICRLRPALPAGRGRASTAPQNHPQPDRPADRPAPAQVPDPEVQDPHPEVPDPNIENLYDTPPASPPQAPAVELDYEVPNPVLEDELQDPAPDPSVRPEVDEPVTYTYVPEGSRLKTDIVIDSLGFSYTPEGKDRYRCPTRPKGGKACPAKLRGSGDQWTLDGCHNHPPKPQALQSALLKKRMKDACLARENLHVSTGSIAKRLLREFITPNQPLTASFSEAALRRYGNRVRAETRPTNPTDIHFQPVLSHLPLEPFYRGDIVVGDQRHRYFQSDVQRDVTPSVKRAYLDGTFKVVADPFAQLWSVHAFVTKDGVSKQVPLLYVLMSSRRKRDYVAVLQKILEICGPLAVEEFMLDFEEALFLALQEVFPNASIKGCVFHWAKAVMSQAKQLGLQGPFNRDAGTNKFIRKVLALPYAPHEKIQEAWETLQEQCQDWPESEVKTLTLKLMDYVFRNWIQTRRAWSPKNWTVFMELIKTNNDTEGWHHGLNNEAEKGNLNFYELVTLLFSKTQDAQFDIRRVQSGIPCRNERQSVTQRQKEIQSAWDAFVAKEYSLMRLISVCSQKVPVFQD